MTVAIAAGCQWDQVPTVVCASDRMLTSGDIEFDSPSFKVFPLTRSIVMLTAGDAAAQMEILSGVRIDIAQRLSHDQSWMWVQEAANIVGRQTVAFARGLVARRLLEPFGLDAQTFLDRQQDFHADFLNGLLQEMQRLRPDTQTLVAGVDQAGAHVYTVDGDGELVNNDAVGFAAIGAGRRHAESQFMFAKHAPWNQFPQTMLLTYTAKRRAEVAPGVGTDTDMCVIKGLGGFQWLTVENVQYLQALFDQSQNMQKLADLQANQKIESDFAEVAAAAKAAQESAAAAAQAPPPTPSLAEHHSEDSPDPEHPTDGTPDQPPSRA